MPRLELQPPTRSKSHLEPPVSADICNECYHALGLQDFSTGEAVPDELTACLDGTPKDLVLGSLAVEHPPYEEGELVCQMCADPLEEEDDSYSDPETDDTDIIEGEWDEVDDEDEEEEDDEDDDFDDTDDEE